MQNFKKTKIHGHRGCRAYFPENTLQGFRHALSIQTQAIELDVVISKDNKVVVSHEHYMHHKKCLWPNLETINKEQESQLWLYQMNYDQIKLFDCGLLPHPAYPFLKTETAFKPLLSEVIETAELTCKELKREPIIYNIEIKSEANLVGLAQPNYDDYAHLVLDVIQHYNIHQRAIIQSFDKEMLRTINRIDQSLPLSLLIEDPIHPFQHIEELGFLPSILASDYIYLTTKNVAELQNKKIKVFAFTVNEIKDIQSILNMGVDAIISDYPDIVYKIINNKI